MKEFTKTRLIIYSAIGLSYLSLIALGTMPLCFRNQPEKVNYNYIPPGFSRLDAQQAESLAKKVGLRYVPTDRRTLDRLLEIYNK